MWWMELISLLNKAFGIAIPLIDEHESRAYTDDEINRNKEWSEILNNENDHDRRNLIADYSKRLLIDTGSPIGRVSGTSIEVPLEYYDTLIRNSNKLVKMTKENDLFMQTIRRQSK